MKQIIFFTSSHKIGLTSLLTEQACSLGKKAGAKFFFVSGENEQMPGLFDKLDKFHINYTKISGLDEHRNFRGLVNGFCKCADTFKPDVVHVQTNWQLAIVVAAKYFYRRNFLILYTVHGYRHNYEFRSLIAKHIIAFFLALFADRVIMPSSFLKRQFASLRKKTELLFLGVDRDFFTEYTPPDFSKPKRIIFPGEFREGKNQDELILYIRQYIDKTGDTNIELYLPGKGAKLRYCETLAKRLGLKDKVFFPGLLDRRDMLILYKYCQFCIIPTNIETFGLCIAESFVLGRVIIARRVGVANDVILHGKTGFLYNSFNELLEISLRILNDAEKCSQVSENAIKKSGVFHWDNISDQYLQLIQKL